MCAADFGDPHDTKVALNFWSCDASAVPLDGASLCEGDQRCVKALEALVQNKLNATMQEEGNCGQDPRCEPVVLADAAAAEATPILKNVAFRREGIVVYLDRFLPGVFAAFARVTLTYAELSPIVGEKPVFRAVKQRSAGLVNLWTNNSAKRARIDGLFGAASSSKLLAD